MSPRVIRLGSRALCAALGVALLVAVACGGGSSSNTTGTQTSSQSQSATPTSASSAQPTKAAAGPTITPTVAPTSSNSTQSNGKIPNIPRNQELILLWGGTGGGATGGAQFTDFDLWNTYVTGGTHQGGQNLIFEPLAYYSAFANKTIPWLAKDWNYTPDFMHLTIDLRHGVKWSDGQPFTSADVVYTYQHLMEAGSKLKWGTNIKQAIKTVSAPDDYTVKIDFNVPSPLFMYFVSYKYDIGVPIVPKHIFQGKDWSSFKDFDISKGWPVTTGPWRVVLANAQEKILDLSNSWWAVDQGLIPSMPAVKRIVYVPYPGETQAAQLFIQNKADASEDVRPNTMEEILKQNPKITTFTGDQKPYGYQDWWPISLFFNDNKPPFNDPNVRWAISYYLDRQQIVSVGWDNAGAYSGLPFPGASYYPALKPFQDISNQIEKDQGLDTTAYDPAKGDARMKAAGYTKNGSGMWVKDGQTLKCDILGLGTLFSDIGPIIAQQLKNHGIDASYSAPTNAGDRQTSGDFSCAMRGHGGSIRDLYFTMQLYQSQSELIPGGHLVNFYKWSNPQWDKLTDQMGETAIDNVAKQEQIWQQAFPIWLKALPDVQIVKWYHRIPENTTYWTNWPSTKDPYINTAPWHFTFPLVLWHLKPAQ